VTVPLILRANAELVTMAYLRQRVLAAYGTVVGAVLQGPDSAGRYTWQGVGFVQPSSVGGGINANVPVRTSVVSLDVWAVNPGSKRPPWGQAFAVAETIVAATYDTEGYDTHAVATLPDGYPDARVTGFRVLTEPGRRPADPSDFARVGFDVEIVWHGLGNTWTVVQP
jgi:hypothetical protein